MNVENQILPIMLTIQLHMPVEKIYGTVISESQSLAFRLFKWLGNNDIKANSGKSHILLSNKKTEKVTINDVHCT